MPVARSARRSLAWLLVPLLVLLAAALSTTRAVPAVRSLLQPDVAFHLVAPHTAAATPPTTADCIASTGFACYSPNQFQVAYNTVGLYAKGTTGAGQTIAVVDSFGSPTIRQDLKAFDKAFGLPDPPALDIVTPAGPIPPYDNSDTRFGWSLETSLDVEYAHAMAPGAKILLVETPVAETEGLVGIPEIVKAENYVINHHLADVISQSFGATEETFPNGKIPASARTAFVNAQAHRVTVMASSGDTGATNYKFNGTQTYDRRVNSWPSSDPLVTSIGGTQLHLDAQGHRVAPDNVWSDPDIGAGGGGLSHSFPRPAFQNSVASIVGDHRGTPDISMSAAVNGGALVYDTANPQEAGFLIIGGTSEASPLFAGIVALADQYAGTDLGDVNAALYRLGSRQAPGLYDVVLGNNTYVSGDPTNQPTVPGFQAVPGYDLASGLGTVLDATTFVPALARAAQPSS